MYRPRRPILAACSVALLMAVLALWARGVWWHDGVGLATKRWTYGVTAGGGQVRVYRIGIVFDQSPVSWNTTRRGTALSTPPFAWGFDVIRDPGLPEFWALAVPAWCLALLPLAGCAWFGRPRHAASGRCPRCGYDLRASPDRCPECGEPSPAATPPRQKTAG